MADSASENYPLRLTPVPPGYSLAEFVTLLLDKCGIVVYPGSGYGASGEGFFRIALTISDERLQEGIQRMKYAGIRYASWRQRGQGRITNT